MKIQIIIHASFEAPGAIARWAQEKGYPITINAPHKGETLSNVEQFDFLIILGGPQSPLELERYPYLRDEIRLIKQAIDSNKKVLGICLGAQLIAAALGAAAEKSEHREIGCYPVEILADDPFFDQLPDQFEVMHWHNDMPGLPQQAVLLAKSAGCSRQAFRYGDRVYGLQFHLEFTQALIEALVKHCAKELTGGAYVSTAEQLLNVELDDMHHKLFRLLDYFDSL